MGDHLTVSSARPRARAVIYRGGDAWGIVTMASASRWALSHTAARVSPDCS